MIASQTGPTGSVVLVGTSFLHAGLLAYPFEDPDL